VSTEQGWVEQPEPGLTETGQSVQAGDAAAQGTIMSPTPGDVVDAPEQIPTDEATPGIPLDPGTTP